MSTSGRLVASRYRLKRHVGGGGMGTVWLADDERLSREVAVKEMVPQAGGDPDADRQQRERTLREGRIAARLSHPHAISVYDVVVEDDRPWLVMEYLPSRSLATVLAEDGVLRVDQVAQIGAQIADALVATHAAGIVHRDVKPANVLIGSGDRIDGLVKITDFGISHATGDVSLTQTGLITGTPAYLAPEVARGVDPGSAADVFSLGATLYACLEGQPPFGRGDNALQLLHRVAAGTIEPPTRCGDLTDTLLDMLATDPTARPDMTEVRDRLATIAAGNDGDPTAVLAAPTDLTTEDLDDPSAVPTTTTPPAADEPSERDRAPVPAARTAAGTGGGRSGSARWGWAAAVAVVALLVGGAAWALAGDGEGDGDETSGPASATPTTSAPPATDADDADTGDEPVTATPPQEDDPPADDPPTDGPDTTDEAEPDAPTSGEDASPVDVGSVERYLDDYHRTAIDDPATAYDRAGPTLRDAISRADYEAFWGRFDEVAIRDVDLDEDGDSATAVMELRFPDGTRQIERHRFDFVDDDGRLVLDRDQFLEIIEPRG
jgi:eukaryotic-like serine/threonine-protein kinase